MSETTTLGGWRELSARLDAAGVTARWAALPALTGLVCLDQLRAWTAPGQPARADDVLAALVGEAAVDGRGDADATLVLLHLLWSGAYRLMLRVRHLVRDPESLVIGELTMQIRHFPIARRTRAHAANLLLDTQTAVWLELAPYRTDRPGQPPELFFNPLWNSADRILAGHETDASDDEDIDLVDMLLWARRTGVVDEWDLAALIEVELARDRSAAPIDFVVHKTGWARRTVQRRHARALAALRAGRADYLAAA